MLHLHLPAAGPGIARSTCSHCPLKPHGVPRTRQQRLVPSINAELGAPAACSRHVATRPIISAVSSSSSSMPSTSEPACAHEQHTDDEPSCSAAWQLLKDFTLKQFRGTAGPMVATKAARDQLRAAFLQVYGSPHPPLNWVSPGDTGVLLGIMASEARLAVRALRDWCQVLDMPFVLPYVNSSTSSSSSSSSSSVGGGAAADATSSEATTTTRSSSDSGSSPGSSSSSLAAVRGPVYLKYNSKTGQCYVSPYRGNDRGVLVQLGQAQLGHFPLGLWDEGMTQPPPMV